MGLDQYIVKITRLSEDERREADRMDFGELCDRYCVIDCNDDEDEALVAPIRDYLYIVAKPQKELNFSAMKSVAGIPDGATMSGSAHGYGKSIYYFSEGDNSYEVTWQDLTDEQRASIEEEVMRSFAIVKRDYLAEFRKDYELEEDIYAACDDAVLNCGWYPVNSAMKEAIQKALTRRGDDDIDWTCDKDSVICYREWY